MLAEDLRPWEIFSLEPQTGFPLVGVSRVFILGASSLARLEEDLIRSVGWEKVSVIFYRFGYEAGLAMAMAVADIYEFESPEEWLRASSVMISRSGAAMVEFEDIDLDAENKNLRFRGKWKNSLGASNRHEELLNGENPFCTILAGIASGYASGVIGTEVMVKETSCTAGGNRYCSFEGRSMSEWGLENTSVLGITTVISLDDEIDRLKEKFNRAKKDLALKNDELRRLRQHSMKPDKSSILVYRSAAMVQLILMSAKVAPTESTVLIQGESGVGKEVLARYIHDNSGRKEEPFLAINCAALPPNLLESELFGHKKGAFTGADKDKTGLFIEAGRGTLFLDEIAEMPMELQAKLLRALQEKEVRPVGGVENLKVKARVVAATNKDLRTMAARGLFREDLFYRLSVFPLTMPPLHQRRQDILILARHFLSQLAPNHPGFSPEAVRLMETYMWPGNVRELQNWVEYAIVLAGDERISPDHLPPANLAGPQGLLSSLALDLPTRAELEARYTKLVLEHTGGNKSEAARILGVSPSTLWRHLHHDKRKA